MFYSPKCVKKSITAHGIAKTKTILDYLKHSYQIKESDFCFSVELFFSFTSF